MSPALSPEELRIKRLVKRSGVRLTTTFLTHGSGSQAGPDLYYADEVHKAIAAMQEKIDISPVNNNKVVKALVAYRQAYLGLVAECGGVPLRNGAGREVSVIPINEADHLAREALGIR